MELMTLTAVTNPKCGYLKQFEHIVDLKSNGVHSAYIEWCNKNCKHHWGWHFWQDENSIPMRDEYGWPIRNEQSTRAFMSFESLEELVLFKLIHFSN